MIPPFKHRGDYLSAEEHNQILQALAAGLNLPGARYDPYTGFQQRRLPNGSSTSSLARFRLVAVGDEYLTAKRIVEGVEETEDTLIAKPDELRRSTYDGKTLFMFDRNVTYSHVAADIRMATNEYGETDVEILTLPYRTADGQQSIITAAFIADGIVVPDGDASITLYWMEVGHRCWSADPPEEQEG